VFWLRRPVGFAPDPAGHFFEVTMASKVVSLTVHKNTRAKHEARANAALIRSVAKAEHTVGDLAGFAIVTWNHANVASCYLHMPEGQPQTRNTVSDYARTVILRALTRNEETE